ncbi:MAG: hypothetical protein ACRC1M_03030 [Methanobacteriaceae archaeon]
MQQFNNVKLGTIQNQSDFNTKIKISISENKPELNKNWYEIKQGSSFEFNLESNESLWVLKEHENAQFEILDFTETQSQSQVIQKGNQFKNIVTGEIIKVWIGLQEDYDELFKNGNIFPDVLYMIQED